MQMLQKVGNPRMFCMVKKISIRKDVTIMAGILKMTRIMALSILFIHIHSTFTAAYKHGSNNRSLQATPVDKNVIELLLGIHEKTQPKKRKPDPSAKHTTPIDFKLARIRTSRNTELSTPIKKKETVLYKAAKHHKNQALVKQLLENGVDFY